LKIEVNAFLLSAGRCVRKAHVRALYAEHGAKVYTQHARLSPVICRTAKIERGATLKFKADRASPAISLDSNFTEEKASRTLPKPARVCAILRAQVFPAL
jgi:hypothetical protein